MRQMETFTWQMMCLQPVIFQRRSRSCSFCFFLWRRSNMFPLCTLECRCCRCRWISLTPLTSNELIAFLILFQFMKKLRVWVQTAAVKTFVSVVITDEQQECRHVVKSSRAKFRCKCSSVHINMRICSVTTWRSLKCSKYNNEENK